MLEYDIEGAPRKVCRNNKDKLRYDSLLMFANAMAKGRSDVPSAVRMANVKCQIVDSDRIELFRILVTTTWRPLVLSSPSSPIWSLVQCPARNLVRSSSIIFILCLHPLPSSNDLDSLSFPDPFLGPFAATIAPPPPLLPSSDEY